MGKLLLTTTAALMSLAFAAHAETTKRVQCGAPQPAECSQQGKHCLADDFGLYQAPDGKMQGTLICQVRILSDKEFDAYRHPKNPKPTRNIGDHKFLAQCIKDEMPAECAPDKCLPYRGPQDECEWEWATAKQWKAWRPFMTDTPNMAHR
jgi:hypothetical protein